MNQEKPTEQPHQGFSLFVHSLDKSALFTIIGIILLFSTAIFVTL
jgi:hypothetical protein